MRLFPRNLIVRNLDGFFSANNRVTLRHFYLNLYPVEDVSNSKNYF